MAVWFNNEGALHEGFAINEKLYAANKVKILRLVDHYFNKEFEVIENWGGNSLWLKTVKDEGYLVDWNSCPQDLKESVQLNIGYSAGNILDKASFSRILIYLNLIDLKRLDEFFKWLGQDRLIGYLLKGLKE